MIQMQSTLNVADNSGAKTVKCIKVLNGFNRRFAVLGDTIIVSIQKLRNRARLTSKVRKGEVHKAVIIRTKNKTVRKDGATLNFQSNQSVHLFCNYLLSTRYLSYSQLN